MQRFAIEKVSIDNSIWSENENAFSRVKLILLLAENNKAIEESAHGYFVKRGAVSYLFIQIGMHLLLGCENVHY